MTVTSGLNGLGSIRQYLPPWVLEWLDVIVPLGQVLMIVVAAWLLRTLMRSVIERIWVRYNLPPEMKVGARRVMSFIVYSAALLLVLERLGVSSSVLWSAFTGFAAVAAVAFFAAWSVLSNIFCAFLIFTTRLFRIHDHVELLENGETKGIKGQVVDINLVYTSLQEPSGQAVLKVPNALFFQRTVRRWHGAPPASPTQVLPE